MSSNAENQKRPNKLQDDNDNEVIDPNNPGRKPCADRHLSPSPSRHVAGEDENETLEEVMRKRTYMKEVLTNGHSTGPEVVNEAQFKDRKFDDQSPDVPSLDFLKTHKEFQIPGRNPMIVPQEEMLGAMDGFTNMQLAHEISVNHEFRLEVHKPPEDSLEEKVRTQLKKAYWDIFDEALNPQNPNPAHAMAVFNEMKRMLLGLLLPHNRGMRSRIENFLNEETMQYEIQHDIIEISKYTNFIIDILGQLCCPVRDSQVAHLKTLEKPSELFKEIMILMEQMQLDMANFLISQIRPTIVKNCVKYEQLKFSKFIEMEYKLNADALGGTKAWLLGHCKEDRPPFVALGKAFAQVLFWTEKDWPETLTLDWARFVALAEDTRRATFLGATVLSAFNSAKEFYCDNGKNSSPTENSSMKFSILRDSLKKDLNLLIQKEDCVSEEALTDVVELLAEQAVKVTENFVHDELGRDTQPRERNIIRKSVQDCVKGSPVRAILVRRIEDYISAITTGGKMDSAEFPVALQCIEDLVKRIAAEFLRIALHNRAVFQDLYVAIIANKLPPPVFLDQNGGVWDSSIIGVMKMLGSESDVLKEIPLTPVQSESVDVIFERKTSDFGLDLDSATDIDSATDLATDSGTELTGESSQPSDSDSSSSSVGMTTETESDTIFLVPRESETTVTEDDEERKQ